MAYNPANAEEAAQALYIGYFGRAGEPGGVSYWIDQINAAPNLATGFALAAAAFSVQQEAKNEYAFLAAPNLASPVAFITSLYNNLLERAPDADGLAYWVGQAEAAAGNPFAIGLLVAQFISGATNSAAGNDIDTITNKVEAASFFTQALADANISGTDANGQVLPDVAAAGKSIIGAVTDDPDTVTAANEASTEFAAGGGSGEGVLITVAAGDVVALNAADPAFRSTEAADTVNGTVGADSSISTAGGNDIVDVTVAADGAEFDLGAGNDSIALAYAATTYEVEVDGGAGENSAIITTTAGIAFGDDITLSNIQSLELDVDGVSSFDASNWDGVESIDFTDGQSTITDLSTASEFSASGDGLGIITYATGDEVETVDVTFDEVVNGGIYFSADDQVETVNLEVVGNSNNAVIYSYATSVVVTGDAELAGTVAFFGTDDAVSFDSSGLEADTALNFLAIGVDSTITFGDADDTASMILSGAFDTTITLGDGEDELTLGTLTNLTLDAGDIDTFASITDFVDGDDVLDVSAIGAAYDEFTGSLVGQIDLEAALAVVSAATTANNFTVFEYGSSTYVYYADGDAGVDAGDGLLEITGVTGLAVGTDIIVA